MTARNDWRRSSFCGTNACVEVVEENPDEGTVTVQVRDSKNPAGPVLRFTPPEWDAFVAGVKSGEFDRPSLSPSNH